MAQGKFLLQYQQQPGWYTPATRFCKILKKRNKDVTLKNIFLNRSRCDGNYNLLVLSLQMPFHYAKKHFLDTNNIVYHSTSLSRVQTTPKTSTNISQYYLYSRRPVWPVWPVSANVTHGRKCIVFRNCRVE